MERKLEKNWRTPVLSFEKNTGREDYNEAVKLLNESEIKFLDVGPSVDFPSVKEVMLEYGFVRYYGVNEIKKFIDEYKNNNLPLI